MAPRKKITVSVQPATPRPTSAERRAAESANLAAYQPKLKQEAADRRRARMDESAGTKRKQSVTSAGLPSDRVSSSCK